MSTPPAPRATPADYADVALPVPLTSPFTYRVPDELKTNIFVGCRVEVPFGRRVLSGIVVDFRSDTSLERVRPIRRLFETYLPGPLLELTRWIARYYGCSVGEAAQSVLPPLLKRASRASPMRGLVRMSTDAAASWEDTLRRAPKQRELARRLATTGGARMDEISAWGFSSIQVRALLDRGIAERTTPTETSSLDTLEEPVGRLSDDQQRALDQMLEALGAGEFSPMLLHGVTGSGKTELYIRAAVRVVEEGGGCIVLVPEIGLLPQAVARYRRVFGDRIAILHSRMTGPERFDMWQRIETGECPVVLGPRSAVFSPVRNLRLIVVDEEQDDSYKQDEKPRYHARNVALMRGKFEGLTIVLGSATPSAESLFHATNGRYSYLTLPARVSGGPLPDLTFVDMREQEGDGFFSARLLERLEYHIGRGHQTILFLNKRGHARFVQCSACGWVAQCSNCDISLTYHRVASRLKCHFCGYMIPAVTRCAQCQSQRLYFSGVGTQRVELDLAAHFPGVEMLRMDADTTAGKDGHRRILEKFGTGRYAVLIGTQMVTKGHHFPGVNLVGVLFAEESLHFPDFRAAERTYQVLTQVAGRAGRGTDRGEVVIQTFQPEHSVFRFLETYDYRGFMREELRTREQLGYPPFARMVLASCVASQPEVLRRVVRAWADRMRARLAGRDVDVLGPVPPVVARIKNRYREQILIKGRISDDDKALLLSDFSTVATAEKGGRAVEARWDVDPETFL